MNKALLSLSVISMVGTLAAFSSPAVADPEPPLRVVALGDSISTANACEGCTAFPELYGALMADRLGREVRVENRSIPGAVTQWLMAQLKYDDEARAAVAAADVVVVTIGFNETPWARIDDPCHVAPNFPFVDWPGITDKCQLRVTNQYESDLEKLLDQIDKVHRGSPYVLRIATVHNAVIGDHEDPGWDSPEAAAVSVRGNALYAAVQCRLAEDHGGRCAELLPLLNGPDGTADADQYLADHTHLNQVGHTLVAQALADLGLD